MENGVSDLPSLLMSSTSRDFCWGIGIGGSLREENKERGRREGEGLKGETRRRRAWKERFLRRFVVMAMCVTVFQRQQETKKLLLLCCEITKQNADDHWDWQ